MTNHIPELKNFRWVVINSSGGKDSQTALTEVVKEADRQGYPRNQIVVSHQDLGKVEWEGTFDLVKKQAEFYGLRVEVTRYRNKDGEELNLLDYVAKRGKWPSSKQRYCTSDFKRGPGSRVITMLFKEAPGDIINVFGFRAEESAARSKKEEWVLNSRLSTLKRNVYDWLPIHNMLEAEVWKLIKESGVPYHHAYDLGMPRLSCCFCIFAPKAALMIAGQANPELLDEYCKVEADIGHTFKSDMALSEIRDALARGEKAGKCGGGGCWNM